ncbi:hypothetical protein GQ457_17G011900 [Hibiscus cannabinus]
MLLLLLSRGFDNLLELDDKGDVSTRDNGSSLGRFSRLIQISAERLAELMAYLNSLCPLTGSDHFGRKSGALSFQKPFIVRCSGDSSPDNFDTKAFRHRLTRSKNYYRKGFGNKEETLQIMNQEYISEMIETLKANGNEYSWGNVKVKLAEAYGFCMGVERAVQMAYGARKQFTDGKIWITNEIIHC